MYIHIGHDSGNESAGSGPGSGKGSGAGGGEAGGGMLVDFFNNLIFCLTIKMC
jgi:hypothetical protein